MAPASAPPSEVAPPSTTMENASKPMAGTKLPARTPSSTTACSPPARPASAPLTAKAASFVRLTLMPRAAAARSLSRTATIDRPGRERRIPVTQTSARTRTTRQK